VTSAVTILLPVLLMLSATVADAGLGAEIDGQAMDRFPRQPVVAMLIATLAHPPLRHELRLSADDHPSLLEESLMPIASVLLIVGAGAGSGASSNRLVSARRSLSRRPDYTFRHSLPRGSSPGCCAVAVGSATVAATTAASLMAPIAAADPRRAVTCSSSPSCGVDRRVSCQRWRFWLVKEYLGLDVAQTLRSWTVIETIISVTGSCAALLLNAA
jgi:GntP family gluconate:H+ symporter